MQPLVSCLKKYNNKNCDTINAKYKNNDDLYKQNNNKKKHINKNDNLIFFIPNNNNIKHKLTQQGISINDNIEAKIISKNNDFIYIGFGIYSNAMPFYKDVNSKITWCSHSPNHIPCNESHNTNSFNKIIKFDIKSLNKDFNIKKRNTIFPSVNDDIIIKINPKFKQFNNQPSYITNIINYIKDISSDTGLKCKVLTYNLWDPPSAIENINDENITLNFTNSIPGAIIFGAGKWNKYKIPFNKNSNQYDLLSHNLFPISDITKNNSDNSYIFYINNKDLFYFNFYILK